MSDPVFNPAALKRLKKIHRLSQQYNQHVGMPHDKRLFELIVYHVPEIQALYNQGDRHFVTETGDLWVLCCELLLEAGADIDGSLNHCFERYEKKLSALIKDAEDKSAQDA